MNSTPTFPGMESLVKPFRFPATPHEYKVTALREYPTPESLQHCDTPGKATAYWRLHFPGNSVYDPERENLGVLLLNTRRRIKGHQLVTIGTQDSLLVHCREIYRLAIVTAANGIIVAHNHPSGVMPYPVLCRMARGLPGVSGISFRLEGAPSRRCGAIRAASRAFSPATDIFVEPPSHVSPKHAARHRRLVCHHCCWGTGSAIPRALVH